MKNLLKLNETIECKCGCGCVINKYNKWYRRVYYKYEHQNIGKKRTDEFRKKQSIRAKENKWTPPVNEIRGDKHWNWRGGISRENNLIRKNSDHKWWSKKILKKCKYTCFLCGQLGSVNENSLIAHHLLFWAKFPKYRFDLNNGITLCVACHKKLHKKLKQGLI